MKKYILIIMVSVFVASCSNYKYPQDAKVSEANGALVDSSASYLLEEINFDGSARVMSWNKERLEELNSYYRLASEPVLYNYYTGRDIYRFVIVEKGKEPLILSVNKDNKRSWIVSKRIDMQNQFDSDSTSTILSVPFDHFTRDLSDEEWMNFTSLWKSTDFYTLTNHEVDEQLDSYCVVESHEEGSYWYVYRSLDDSSLKEISTYVKSLTRF